MSLARFRFFAARLTRSLWFRPTVATLGAVGALALAPAIERIAPEAALAVITVGDVETILGVLSSSMLAVAIFSLGTMVSALQASSGAATPRARPLLTRDRTAQTAISTFIGAFLFSVLGQVGLALDLYDAAGRAVLFGLSLLLIAAVTLALIAWIRRLSSMGGVAEAVDIVERATADAFGRLARAPCFGGSIAEAPPFGAEPVAAGAFGFVQHVDAAALHAAAERVGGLVHVAVRPGAWVHPKAALAHATDAFDDDGRKAIRAAFTLGGARDFENDPRFGLIALSEIASRALSPAVNDPGTAIDVIAAQVRVLAGWREAARAAGDEDAPSRPRLSAPPLEMRDLFEDAFRPIARDGAGCIEIGLRLQKSLLALEQADPAFAQAARAMRADIAERALAALAARGDREALTAAAGPAGPAALG